MKPKLTPIKPSTSATAEPKEVIERQLLQVIREALIEEIGPLEAEMRQHKPKMKRLEKLIAQLRRTYDAEPAETIKTEAEKYVAIVSAPSFKSHMLPNMEALHLEVGPRFYSAVQQCLTVAAVEELVGKGRVGIFVETRNDGSRHIEILPAVVQEAWEKSAPKEAPVANKKRVAKGAAH